MSLSRIFYAKKTIAHNDKVLFEKILNSIGDAIKKRA